MASSYSDMTWYSWNDSTATTATSTDIWSQWTYSTDSTAAATLTTNADDYVWITWNDTGSTSMTYTSNDETVWQTWTEKHEVIQQRRAEDAQREINRISHEDKKNNAEATAKELLLDLIGPDELKVYEETGRLFVKGKRFDYIVQKDGFVEKLTKNKIVDLCIHLKDKFKYPETDNVISLKMAIEGNEKEVLKMANNHGSRPRGLELDRAACM